MFWSWLKPFTFKQIVTEYGPSFFFLNKETSRIINFTEVFTNLQRDRRQGFDVLCAGL